MEDNDWDLNVVVRSCNINKPNDVTVPNSGLVTSENDDWNTFFDKNVAADIPNFNDLSEIFSVDFSVAHQKKSNDHVIITDQNNNQEMYLHPIQPNQSSQQIILPSLPTTITCVPTTTTTPQESIYLQQQLEKSDDQIIIMNQNGNPEMYLDPIQPTQFSQQIFLPPLPTMITKNQSTRVFYEVLQEELTNDKWAWHKYGQKSIKGSPFPRFALFIIFSYRRKYCSVLNFRDKK
ncbi:hypothetical protein R3W88_008873 [Solanum pinnatisectum]|uniref:WRKY domain-containing protein n=1 Tax=Solanum pinnatisectum TaxID=50273 RepID=A0AAV9MBC1_9SOLN|nr:hypothetical protein R3W88_008873 [Solanum pinnatisectum]